jgi:hydrogenase maturation protease
VHHTSRIIIACVGNVLRMDDGFGYAVAARLDDLPAGVEVLESGIGGMTLVHELMRGCAGLIVVDAVDRGAEPGTVFVIEPDVPSAEGLADIHLANPDSVLAMAKGLGCLPDRVLLVGCQPADTDSVAEGLTPDVERAVAPAVDRIRHIVRSWTAG